MRNGYWIKNTDEDKVLLINIGRKSHISFLIQNPELFNLSSQAVNERYAFHSEPVGYEGKARNDLMIRALKNGWVRVRNHHSPSDNWMIQCGDNDKCMIYVSKFFDHVLNQKVLSLYQRVTISDLKGNVIEYMEFADGKDFFFSREKVERMKGYQIVETHFSDF